jgi:hypothetical protein
VTFGRRAGIALATLVMACGSQPRTGELPSPAQQGDSAQLEGVVAVVGSEPFTQVVLQTSSGQQVAVVGDLRSELANLVGLTVRVTGGPSRAVPPADRAINVRRYDVLGIQGDAVYVGILERSGDEYRLRADSTWQLVSVPEQLAAEVGAKVWIAGERQDNRITVGLFGIIKPAQGPG